MCLEFLEGPGPEPVPVVDDLGESGGTNPVVATRPVLRDFDEAGFEHQAKVFGNGGTADWEHSCDGADWSWLLAEQVEDFASR